MINNKILTPQSLKFLRQYVSDDLLKKCSNEKINKGNLDHVAKYFINKKAIFRKLIRELDEQGISPPFYIYEESEFIKSIKEFKRSFTANIPKIEIYYALKINHHDDCIHDAVKNGLNLEVASIRELKMALKAQCKKILYFSPGKTIDDLQFAIQHSDCVTIHIDSFSELERLGRLTSKEKIRVKAGVRIFISQHENWNKYGISLDSLHLFWKECTEKYPFIDLRGIFFHTSRNKDASIYVQTIKDIASHLKLHFSDSMIHSVKYLDFGGGYDTDNTEGIFPESTQLGSLAKLVSNVTGQQFTFQHSYYIQRSLTIEQYAQQISAALNTYLRPVVGDIQYITEPGRVLVNNAMHLLVRVEDVKNPNLAITGGGGVHMVGWQRFLFEYFVKINLTHPSTHEKKMVLSGSLCTTYDTWGSSCYAKSIQCGDDILIPYQGALTYTLAHSFINDIPPVYKIPLV